MSLPNEPMQYKHANGLTFPEIEGNISSFEKCQGLIKCKWQRDIDITVTGRWMLPAAAEAVICIKYNNKLCWAPITTLSGTKLEQYRTYIGQYINHSISADTARSTTTPPDLQLILSMYNGMSKKQKGEFVTNNDTFNASSLKGKICFACYAYNENLHKCIHVDCTGCCKACQSIPLLVPEETLTDAGGGGDPDAPPTMHLVCRACHRKQEIQCPICLESKARKDLCIIGCHHAFCWKCYGMGVMKGQQITKCPMCRAVIVEVKDI